jgi:hypothetical protein
VRYLGSKKESSYEEKSNKKESSKEEGSNEEKGNKEESSKEEKEIGSLHPLNLISLGWGQKSPAFLLLSSLMNLQLEENVRKIYSLLKLFNSSAGH